MQVGDKLIVNMYTSSPDGEDYFIGDKLEVIGVTGTAITVRNLARKFTHILLKSTLEQMVQDESGEEINFGR